MGGSRRESATCDHLLTTHDLDAAANVSWTITRPYKNTYHSLIHVTCNLKIRLESYIVNTLTIQNGIYNSYCKIIL